MAAEVGQRFSGWSCSDLPYNDHGTQDASVQQMVLDHGSVSFGRFASESLSWEKRSVFAHNRRQEEISKLTAPGLVAQKKAFFEEYYKRKAQRAMHQTETTSEEMNYDSTLGLNCQADQLPAFISDHPVASAPSSGFEPSTEVSSTDESKCQDAHELGYLTFNPLFSQTAGLQNIQQEETSSSGQKQYPDHEFPCAAHTSSNHGLSCEALERKGLAPRRVVSDVNGESNVAGSRIVLPIASEGLKVDREKRGARKDIAIVNRPMKRSKDLSTSGIHIPKVDLRRNTENKPSQDMKDPFHKRVEMKLHALSDRMSADRAAASSRSASYQPPDRAMTSCRSSYQNADRLATSSRSSLCQNTNRVLAHSKSAAQASHKSPKGVQRADALPRGIFFNKGSHASHVASSNSTATRKAAAKVSLMPSSSQVSEKTSRTAQVKLKGAAGLTSVNNGSQNKRKQLSTPAALDENNPKRGYVRKSVPTSARSSSDNLPPTAKAPKISNRTNVSKTELVQKSRSAGHSVGGGRSMTTKLSVSCNEQNRKVTSSRAGSLAVSSRRSNLTGPSPTKNKPRQERPRWR